MAEDRPISTVNSEYATPPPSVLALDSALEPPRTSFFSAGPSIGPSIAEDPSRDSRALSTAGPEVDKEAPVLALDNAPLEPPRASFFNPGPSIAENSLRDSRAVSTTGPEVDKEASTPAHSTALLPAGKYSEDPASQYAARSRPFYRRPVWLAIALGALVALILAIILPVYFTVIRKSNNNSNAASNSPGSGSSTSSSAGPTATGSPTTPSGAITGGDGSTIISGNTSFVYKNPFGGYCEFFPTSNYLRTWAPDGRRGITRLVRELPASCVCIYGPSWLLGGAAMGSVGFRRAFLGSRQEGNIVDFPASLTSWSISHADSVVDNDFTLQGFMTLTILSIMALDLTLGQSP